MSKTAFAKSFKYIHLFTANDANDLIKTNISTTVLSATE